MRQPFVNIHTHSLATPPDIAIESVRLQGPGQVMPTPGSRYSLGIHPWDIPSLRKDDINLLMKQLECDKYIIAIGETGLDKSRRQDPREESILRAQLEVAQRRKLPVILHCVRAFEPMMNILKSYDLRAVLFHGFIGSAVQAKRAAAKGYCLSLGERSLQSAKTIEAMRSVPLKNIFLETDAADISIADIYARAANLLDISVDELAAAIYTNYKTVFE